MQEEGQPERVSTQRGEELLSLRCVVGASEEKMRDCFGLAAAVLASGGIYQLEAV